MKEADALDRQAEAHASRGRSLLDWARDLRQRAEALRVEANGQQRIV